MASLRRPKMQIKPKIANTSSIRLSPHKTDCSQSSKESSQSTQPALSQNSLPQSSQSSQSSSTTQFSPLSVVTTSQSNVSITSSESCLTKPLELPNSESVSDKSYKISEIDYYVKPSDDNEESDDDFEQIDNIIETNEKKCLTQKQAEESNDDNIITKSNERKANNNTLTTEIVVVLSPKQCIELNDNAIIQIDTTSDDNVIVTQLPVIQVEDHNLPASSDDTHQKIDSVVSVSNNKSVTNKSNEKVSQKIVVEKQKNLSEKGSTKTVKSKKRKTDKMKTQTDKTKMTMRDLLIYNPPMTEEQKELRKTDSESDNNNKVVSADSSVKDDAIKVTRTEADSTTNVDIGPRVKVGLDGTLILDEESVIVKRKRKINDETVYETARTTSAHTNYASFRNRSKTTNKPRWSEHETTRFYSALNMIGTDFTLMANVFFKGKRSRLDLRNKFKKEEKTHKHLIDNAIISSNFMTHSEQIKELLTESSSDDESDKETNNENITQT